MKAAFLKSIFWIPALLWILFLLLESILIQIHEVFYLVVGVLPIVSVVVLLYFATIFVVKRSKRNRLVFLTVLAIILVKYTDHLISFGSHPSEEAIELKVLTWNLQRLGVFSKKHNYVNNLKKLSVVLKSWNADVVVLQEISKKQTRQLLSYLGLHSGNAQWTYYFKGASGGLAILLLNNTDWSLNSERIMDLPPSWKGLYSEIKHSSGQKVNLMGIHIVPPKVTETSVKKALKSLKQGDSSGLKENLQRYVRQAKIQTKQIDRLNDMVSKFKDPTIIAGDFNSTSQLPIHKELRFYLKDTWLEGGNGIGSTRKWAGFLPFRIDYIYVTKEFEIITTSVGEPEFSDHNPVISDLFLSNELEK